MSEPQQNGAGRAILAELRAMEARLMAEIRKLSAVVPSSNGDAVASDVDLDGTHGDPDVKKDPKRWDGPSQAPCRMSECPPEYLDVLADFLKWKADHPREGKEKYAEYDRRDAARARGWAARKRAMPDEL